MSDERFDDVFTLEEYTSEERYDLAKFIEFKGDCHDVLCSPFIQALTKLPVWRYYRVNEGYKDIDLISYDAYGTLWYAPLIQLYNGTVEETFPEDTVLYLFKVEDLENLYTVLADKDLTEIG